MKTAYSETAAIEAKGSHYLQQHFYPVHYQGFKLLQCKSRLEQSYGDWMAVSNTSFHFIEEKIDTYTTGNLVLEVEVLSHTGSPVAGWYCKDFQTLVYYYSATKTVVIIDDWLTARQAFEPSYSYRRGCQTITALDGYTVQTDPARNSKIVLYPLEALKSLLGSGLKVIQLL